MPNTLVPYGLEEDDDADRAFYFTQSGEPKEITARIRWSRVHRVIGDEYDYTDLCSSLRSFYRTGIRSFTVHSKVALQEFVDRYPPPEKFGPPPPSPGDYARWVERMKSPPRDLRPSPLTWLGELYNRAEAGKATGHERLFLEQIEREVSDRIRELVRKYQDKRDYLAREERRRELERRDRTRRAALRDKNQLE